MRFLGPNEVEPKSGLAVKLLLLKLKLIFGAGVVNTSNKQPHTSTPFIVPEAVAMLHEDRSLAATLNSPGILCKCLRGRTAIWRVWETVQEVLGHMPVQKVPFIVSSWDKIIQSASALISRGVYCGYFQK